ncbi:Hsp20/alpha crystallin family protein [Paraflavisolibacter sp. H34]|uniref:Hsp20/alpha crystallin family protein n=1 Tax=Huijunlia imazamoxiresistens TaxID=3127457 RepID=UPI003015F0EE
MAIVKRNSNYPALPSFMNDFWAKDLWNWGQENHSATNTTIPAVNLKETADNFEVEVAAPGMKKEDFKIELNNNMLTIRSEKEDQHEQKEGERYSRREFSYQSFQRVFQLPVEVVDAERITARYENGLLQLLIPKRDHARQKPPRTIEIA